MNTLPLFELRGVSATFTARAGLWRRGRAFKAVDRVTLSLFPGTSYALVGESGSGKTTLARLLAGLLEPAEGDILVEGDRLQGLLSRDARTFRRRVQMVFQSPYLSLDPRWNVDRLVSEGIDRLTKTVRQERVARVLQRVGLDASYLGRRPAALSGGERQRVALARALVMEPDFLILDEPTSQLDVCVQKEIVDFLRELQRAYRGGLLFITHDMVLASRLAERILVLEQGKIVEEGTKREVLANPRHPYTRKLLSAIPPWPPRGAS